MYAGKWLDSLSNNVSHGRWKVHPDLWDTVIGSLNGAQWILRAEDDLMPFVEAIERADLETVEKARPQLFQALSMMHEALWVRHLAHDSVMDPRGLFAGGKTVLDMVDTIIQQAACEGERHFKRAKEAPTDVNALSGLAAAVTVLADAKAACAALAVDGGYREETWVRQAAESFGRLAEGADLLRGNVGPLYADVVRAFLPDPAEIEAGALARVQDGLSRGTGHLEPANIRRGLDIAGDWEPGRRMLAGAEDTEKPLSPERAEELRGIVAGALAEYDAVFHRPGFVNLLRQAAVMARTHAAIFIKNGTVADVAAAARSQRYECEERLARGRYYVRAELEAEIAKPLAEREARIAEQQTGMLSEARRWSVLGEQVDSFLVNAAQSLGVAPPVRRARIEREGDLLVLRGWAPDKVMVVYPEGGRKGGAHPDAVFAAVMDATRAAGGIPPLEHVREAPWAKGTNFRNLDDFLASLREPEMQEHAFGGPVVVENAEEMAPKKSRRQVA